MAIDPADYDVVELRGLALDGSRRSDRLSPGRAGRRSGHLGDLAEHDRRSAWLGSHEERHKPYLRRIPRERALREALREWLQRLVDRAGPRGAADALSHYERLGWITESVETELRATLPDPDRYPDAWAGGSVDDLTRLDHVRGLSVISLAQLGADGERLADERPSDTATHPPSRERTTIPPRGRSP
jgi:flagellar protein FlaE